MTGDSIAASQAGGSQSTHARASARGVIDVLDPDTIDPNEVAEVEANTESDETTGFFYGTLMTPEVFFRVCYARYSDQGPIPQALIDHHGGFKPAILHGYRRHKVRHADYPGIVADDKGGSSVRGVLVTNLTPQNYVHLNLFEGSQYKRCQVKVKMLDKVGDDSGAGNVEGDEVSTFTYVFKDAEDLEEGEWDFQHFKEEKLWKWA